MTYMDRYLLREHRPPGPSDSDHLICVFPSGITTPTLYPDATTRSLLQSQWRTASVGHPVPGWAKVLSYYRALSMDSGYLNSLNIGDRALHPPRPAVKPTRDTPTPANPGEIRALTSRITAMERQAQQIPTTAGMERFIRQHALPIVRGLIEDQVKAELVPLRQRMDQGMREIANLRDDYNSIGETVTRMQDQIARLVTVDEAIDQRMSKILDATQRDADIQSRITAQLEARLRSLEAWEASRVSATAASVDAQTRIEQRLDQLEQMRVVPNGKRTLPTDGSPDGSGDSSP